MAESAVTFLLEYLEPLLSEEVILLKGVRDEACQIRDELDSMRALLKDADARGLGDESIKTWVKQVREAAYDAEDILDEFLLCLGPQQHKHVSCGLLNFLREKAFSIKRIKARHRIAMEIRKNKERICEISRRKYAYNFSRADDGSPNNPGSSDNQGCYYSGLDALFVDEADLVAIDGPKRQLMDWLLDDGDHPASPISVVGMGGLGKTTLVRKIYNSEQVKKHFQTYAWVTASQSFDRIDLLRSVIKQFYRTKEEQPPSEVDATTDVVQLIQMLQDYLRDQRYVFVVDDLWDKDAWKFIRIALPSGGHGSRVILTTRNGDVASFCCDGVTDRICNLASLSEEEAWTLFCKRAFRSNDSICPPELMGLAKSFVKKCRGLPLAIVTLGGLLATKEKTYAEWEMVLRSLGAELETDDNMKRMMKILMLSYDELPHYLKSCFLYLSIFPEDYLIKRMELIRLWVAEGFVGRTGGRQPEEVAEGYLNMLIARSLVQVVERKRYGKIISCRLHDLLRELIMSKSMEEQLFASSSIERHEMSSKSIRRMSICDKGYEVAKYEEVGTNSRLRSLFCFGPYNNVLSSNGHVIASFASGLRLLRVLHLESLALEIFPDCLTSLFHLRYLSLENSKLQMLPKSIGRLTKLETLNLKGTLVLELPPEILEIHHLRHLLVYRYHEGVWRPFDSIRGTRLPGGLSILRSLQKLAHVRAERDVVRELGDLTQLRRLGIIDLRKEDGPDFCNSVGKMSHLQALFVASVDENEVLDLNFFSHPSPALRRLYLRGRLEKIPDWIPSLDNLVVLLLQWSGLNDDPLQALQSLPNLVVLALCRKAYDGERLSCMARGYLKLKELTLIELERLKEVRLEKGAMPNLQFLYIGDCKELAEVPSCLQYLTNLEELTLVDMSQPFLEGLREGEQLADFTRHIPLINVWRSRNQGE